VPCLLPTDGFAKPLRESGCEILCHQFLRLTIRWKRLSSRKNGWLEEERAVLELLTGIKRAGADMIITYHAKEAVGWMKK